MWESLLRSWIITVKESNYLIKVEALFAGIIAAKLDNHSERVELPNKSRGVVCGNH